MKKYLIFLVLFSLSKTKAQVVFCPPGAEWHYLFSGTIFWPGTTYNEKIKYVGDSINGLDTLKILTHYRFYTTCGPGSSKTYIKQKGDTVFFKNNRTQGIWQILYNFAATAGQSWQTTTILSLNTPKTFTFTVQSVSTVTINGYPLRQLTIDISHWGGHIITERFGSDAFLFNFNSISPNQCDGDVLMEFLCYQDDAFGVKQFGEKSCDYYTRNTTGINEKLLEDERVKIYPNPVNDKLHFEIIEPKNEPINLTIMNPLGQVVYTKTMSRTEEEIDLSDLKSGIYLLNLFYNKELIRTAKLIKE